MTSSKNILMTLDRIQIIHLGEKETIESHSRNITKLVGFVPNLLGDFSKWLFTGFSVGSNGQVGWVFFLVVVIFCYYSI